jgi:hypothetical protein
MRLDMLCKIWQCVGLSAGRADRESAGNDKVEGENQKQQQQQQQQQQQEEWNGVEVLTTLLACLGFAWKDVELIWEDCSEEDDAAFDVATGEGEVALFDERDINRGMPRIRRHKSKVLSQWRQQEEQLSGLLEANIRSAPNAIRLLELAVSRIRRFIARQRLSRAVSHIAQRAQGAGPLASLRSVRELSRLDGCEVRSHALCVAL